MRERKKSLTSRRARFSLSPRTLTSTFAPSPPPLSMPFSSLWLSNLERALDLLHHGHYDEALLSFDEVRDFDLLELSSNFLLSP